MNPCRILIAGTGNVFLADDGFGVAVAQRLANEHLPSGVGVRDFGIRGLHLAFELLDPPALLILVDAVKRGEPPGTLYVIEPDLSAGADAIQAEAAADPHGMTLPAVFSGVAALGAHMPRVLIVGCEPARLDATMALSPVVERAIGPAAQLVRELVDRELARLTTAADPKETTHAV